MAKPALQRKVVTRVASRLPDSAVCRPAERHFYRRQHQDCLAKARSAISGQALSAVAGGSDPSAAARRLTPAEEKKLLHPLLRLRQACCHPQVWLSLFTCMLVTLHLLRAASQWLWQACCCLQVHCLLQL